MEVHCNEGVAIHIGPEPCAVTREGVGEASVGDGTGQPLNHGIGMVSGAEALLLAEGNTIWRVSASALSARRGRRSWHVPTLLVRELGDLMTGQEGMRPIGPYREGEEPQPMMNGREKPDSVVVATKPVNKAVQPAAEPVERRTGTERNTGECSMCRTQGRANLSQALDRFGKRSSRSDVMPLPAWTG